MVSKTKALACSAVTSLLLLLPTAKANGQTFNYSVTRDSDNTVFEATFHDSTVTVTKVDKQLLDAAILIGMLDATRLKLMHEIESDASASVYEISSTKGGKIRDRRWEFLIRKDASPTLTQLVVQWINVTRDKVRIIREARQHVAGEK